MTALNDCCEVSRAKITAKEEVDYERTNKNGIIFIIVFALLFPVAGQSANSSLVIDDIISKSPSADVRAFGAKGDGITDDTLALQAAISYASANNLAVIIVGGSYKTTSQLTVPTGVSILGSNNASVVAGAVINSIFSLAGDNTISGIILNCNNSSNGTSITQSGANYGIYIQNSSRNKIRYNKIYNHNYAGIYINTSAIGQYSDDNEIIDNEITGFNLTPSALINGSHHNIRIENLGGTTQTTIGSFTYSDAYYINNTKICNNKFKYGTYGVMSNFTTGTQLIGNTFDTFSRAIVVQQKSRKTLISGNQFINIIVSGVAVAYGPQHINIIANIFRGTTTGDSSHVLVYFGVDFINVIGNNFDSEFTQWVGPDNRSPGAAIQIGQQVQHGVISDNVMRGFLWGIGLKTTTYETIQESDPNYFKSGFRDIVISNNKIYGDYYLASQSGYRLAFPDTTSLGIFVLQSETWSDKPHGGWDSGASILNNTVYNVNKSFYVASSDDQAGNDRADLTNVRLLNNEILAPSGNGNMFPDYFLTNHSMARKKIDTWGNSWNFVEDGSTPNTSGLAYGEVVFVKNASSTAGTINRYFMNSSGNLVPSITPGTSPNVGDTNVTCTVGTTAPTVLFATTLTANRTVTLSTSGAFYGAKFRIVRTGLGAFTINVGGLRTIPASTAAFVDVEFDGLSWQLTGYGTL